MKAWQEDYLHEFWNIGDEYALFRAMSKFAAGLDFEFCTHFLRAPWPPSNPSVHVTSNYSADWQRRYSENDYLSIAPVVRHCLRSHDPLAWDGALFEDTPDFYEESCAEGVRYGWTMPCHCPNNVLSLLSLARSGKAISASELKDKQFKLAWLAQAARLGAIRHLLPRLMPAQKEELTERELSVLRWTADGKNSNDIAEILRISKRTVDFHASNAASKLGAPNRTAAVLAAMLGLL